MTAESSNEVDAITEQIDSEDEKWKAVFEVARALRGNGKIAEAETQYLKIITEAPENFQSISLLSLGEMLSFTDRKDSARRYLLQLVKLLQQKPELDPKRDQLEKAVTLIARIYGDQGRYEEAENWAKTYLNRFNPDASEDSPFVKELKRILKRRYY
ncbi:tetratricopeptide repeat domain protein [Leptospira borgpetersenii serovar Pomona str. 200901868]|uniref:Tetratricopeptide repeat domain protein n=1 Tax=Leptospira borgpetersenii serovar Pomona str. 200901868 TaxID=1192866 RepID=M6WQU9_LEPBO|nr:tetratricopeptide repeat domain protein [Leptospira borgpetersenii serovar Pomona str. 200901868]